LKRICLSFFVLSLVACGTGIAPTITAPPIQKVIPTDVFVVGNSLAEYGADPSLGWPGNWGMAATAQANDFSHLVAAALGLPVVELNISTMEQNPSTAATVIAPLPARVHPGTIVVVELGENVSDLTGVTFQPAYDQLLKALNIGAKLLCVSTWWQANQLDVMMQKECSTYGGIWVYIGDIYTNPLNPDLTDNLYANPAVNSHPHDWGMAQIATRVLAATK
jgi:hypothetical protein